MTTATQRSCPRVSKLLLIAYINREEGVQKSPVLLGRTLDLSPVGAGMEVFQPVRIGSTMELDIDIMEETVAVQGTVVHSREEREGIYHVGIRFTAPEERLARFGRTARP